MVEEGKVAVAKLDGSWKPTPTASCQLFTWRQKVTVMAAMTTSVADYWRWKLVAVKLPKTSWADSMRRSNREAKVSDILQVRLHQRAIWFEK
ncbi:hypothetical protein Nepgr_025800 [Nepenthes gracilis]|uniref:Uncharacterized protein n=1 Tax=Nepenthes gracilis TaxID=150966 RepID=A0AAD3T8K9_NEPGR|nr:hypothetical protein Nepgr_025800 [Nepenthes gracilis]